jgi:hypothetical protein
MIRIAILTGLLALGLPCLRAADDKKDDKKAAPAKPVAVPFELLKSGHMAVNVKINGKGPFKLIFDTGAPITLVNNKLAKEAGLLKGTPKPAFTLFGAMGEVKIKDMDIGGAKTGDVAAMVMDHPTVELIGQKLGTPIYGLVGFPFFARFKMTLDYQAKTMTLAPSTYKAPTGDLTRNMMQMLLSGGTPKTLAPAAQWGLMAGKETGDDDDGVDVKSVVPDSAADKAGLKRGDRLLTLDGRWTDSLTDLYEAAGKVKPGTTVKVTVKRAGKEIELKVTPAKGM